MEQLGVGATLRFADLDADRLESALRTALDADVVARAATLGDTLRSRPSAVSRAADLVEAAAARR